MKIVEMPLDKGKISLLPAVIAAFTLLCTLGPIVFWISAAVSKSEAKDLEHDLRIDRQSASIIQERALLIQVNERTARMEGMMQLILERTKK